MTKHRLSSNVSPPLRVELGASRALSVALVAIGVLAAAGLFLTDLPKLAALACAPLCIAAGAVLARREAGRAARLIHLRSDGTVVVDDTPVEDVRIEWQGPIGALAWRRDGRRERTVLWPDVVDAARRRELRLWVLTRPSRAATAAVAP